MIILKLIEWLGQERKPSKHSTLDADLLFMTFIGLIALGIFILDKVV